MRTRIHNMCINTLQKQYVSANYYICLYIYTFLIIKLIRLQVNFLIEISNYIFFIHLTIDSETHA